MPPKPRYREVTTAEELHSILGPPSARAANKERQTLHPFHRQWISACPFVLVATSDSAGHCDVSPKGDPAGFTYVIDEATLAIPERPGNRRADGFHNVLQNPHVGLLYVIPGRTETLRINGRATILSDAPFFDALIVSEHRPALALLVEVDTVFFHCSKALLRSKLWEPETWAPDRLPPRSAIAHSMERSDQSAEEVKAHYQAQAKQDLYRE